jgi:hypothetical protein
MHHAEPTKEQFAAAPIDELPHVLFQFHKLPASRNEELEVEFPHHHTRGNRHLGELFSIEES